MPFASLGLVPELVRAVFEEGYAHPTPIQQETIPLALAGRDVIGSAQTGTGKTAAFLLPILQRLSRHPNAKATWVLVLAPTRELAVQIDKEIISYGRFINVRTVAVYGGVGYKEQLDAFEAGAHIVVGTPGRVLDHLLRRSGCSASSTATWSGRDGFFDQ